jgi:hypothetical protein
VAVGEVENGPALSNTTAFLAGSCSPHFALLNLSEFYSKTENEE